MWGWRHSDCAVRVRVRRDETLGAVLQLVTRTMGGVVVGVGRLPFGGGRLRVPRGWACLVGGRSLPEDFPVLKIGDIVKRPPCDEQEVLAVVEEVLPCDNVLLMYREGGCGWWPQSVLVVVPEEG